MAAPRNLEKLALTPEQTAVRRRLESRMWQCTQEGKHVPCLSNREPYDGEGPMQERIAAAQRCGDCPVFAECDAWRLTGTLNGGLIAAGQIV